MLISFLDFATKVKLLRLDFLDLRNCDTRASLYLPEVTVDSTYRITAVIGNLSHDEGSAAMR